MATPNNKLALAETAIALHVKRGTEPGLLPDGSEGWDIDSRILFPGETLPLSELAPYQADAIAEGKVDGVVAVTPGQLKQRIEMYNKVMGLSSTPEEVAESDPEFPVEEF